MSEESPQYSTIIIIIMKKWCQQTTVNWCCIEGLLMMEAGDNYRSVSVPLYTVTDVKCLQ